MLEKMVGWAGVVFELHIGMINSSLRRNAEPHYHTIKCVSQMQRLTWTLRKLLAMLYSENYLEGQRAIGKKKNLNSSVDKEKMGAIKGTTKM